MSEVKVSIEAASLKELLHDFAEALEEMGSIVLRRGDELPEDLDSFLKTYGILLAHPGTGFSKELLNHLIEEDMDETVDNILKNPECRQKIIDLLQDQGYKVSSSENENWE